MWPVTSAISSLAHTGTVKHRLDLAFAFANNNTSLSTTLNFKPQVDSQYINDGNSLYVGFYPFVSGKPSFTQESAASTPILT